MAKKKKSKKPSKQQSRKKSAKKSRARTRKARAKAAPKRGKKAGKRAAKRTPTKKRRPANRKTTGLKALKSSGLSGEAALAAEQRRQNPRIPIRLKVDYFKDSGVFLYDYSRNLGRGGLFIETAKPLPPGTEIRLNFKLPDPKSVGHGSSSELAGQGQTVEVLGRVVWIHEPKSGEPLRGVPGMGIQFVNPEGEHKELLDRFFREIDYDNLSF